MRCIPAALAFQPPAALRHPSSAAVRTFTTKKLNIVAGDKEDVQEKVKKIYANAPKAEGEFDALVRESFPGAVSNVELATSVVDVLAKKGYKASNTLLATSLCADELARRLEDDFVRVYGNNFNLGGLSGFPFAGNTGFGGKLWDDWKPKLLLTSLFVSQTHKLNLSQTLFTAYHYLQYNSHGGAHPR